ncbi:hypothetical protein Agub_g11777, partial [Astrephomene gubernaculifera]
MGIACPKAPSISLTNRPKPGLPLWTRPAVDTKRLSPLRAIPCNTPAAAAAAESLPAALVGLAVLGSAVLPYGVQALVQYLRPRKCKRCYGAGYLPCSVCHGRGKVG